MPSPPPDIGSHVAFQATHWSVVMQARETSSPQATEALNILCRDYWYPLYAFIRRRGHSPAEAQDLTQAFFAHLLERPWLNAVEREKGRFRTYLLACLTRFLTNEWHRANGPTRRPAGGLVPLETDDAENRYVHEPADHASPDALYDRLWVQTLIRQVKARLQLSYAQNGKLTLFQQLEPHLVERSPTGAIPAIATALNMDKDTVRVALFRMRQRFGELLREAVAQTLANPSEVDAEIRSLLTAWN